MRGLTKKIATVVLALTLVVGMSAQCLAATWGSYFGAPVWYEAAEGALTAQSATGWTANMTTIGWGGCWGAQVFQNAEAGFGKVTVKKGQTYKLSCTLKSSNIDKWVFIKVATGESYAFGKWVQLKRAKVTNINETFVAKADASTIYFGLGGDMGDRTDEGGINAYKWTTTKPNDVDAGAATSIVMSNYKLSPMLKAVSKKGKNVTNLVKFLKTNGKITATKSGYKCTIKRSGSAVVLQAVKGKKKVVNLKVKKSNYKKVFKKVNKKGAKALSAVLKANSGLTLKNLGSKY